MVSRKGLKKEFFACLLAGGMLTLPGNVLAQNDGSNIYDFRKGKNAQEQVKNDELAAAEAELMEKLNSKPATKSSSSKKQAEMAANDLESALAREKAILEKLEAASGDEPVKAVKATTPAPKMEKAEAKKTTPAPKAMAKAPVAKISSKKTTTAKKMNASLKKLQASKTKISTKITKASSRVQELLRQLEETQNRLMIAETEVERLSKIIEARNIQNLSAHKMKRVAQGGNRHMLKPVKVVERYGDKDITEDMNIATVVVAKANLRTGPGLNNSPLMTVSKGTRLAVETRRGEWYRVIAPSGTRAWVSGDVVRFGKDNRSEPSRTVNVKGYDADLEGNAIKLIRDRS
jgi:hypothetical protein